MSFVTYRGWRVMSLLLAGVLLVGLVANRTQAEEWKMENGGVEAGKFVLGARAGFAPVTQQVTGSSPPGPTSTDVGSLVNFEGMYSLNTWLLIGMMLEWERHSMSSERFGTDLGHQDTVSVLPTVELRPVRFGPISPYVNMSLGVNVNSFGESNAIRGTTISPSNTLAWRLGWGADYMLTKQFALNTEMAYKRNDGHVTVNGVRNNDWNASSFGFLFGVKMFF
jgi:opacity protein-like surface antigen